MFRRGRKNEIEAKQAISNKQTEPGRRIWYKQHGANKGGSLSGRSSTDVETKDNDLGTDSLQGHTEENYNHKAQKDSEDGIDRRSFITGTYDVSMKSLMEDFKEPIVARAQVYQYPSRNMAVRNVETLGQQKRDGHTRQREDEHTTIEAKVTPVSHQQYSKSTPPSLEGTMPFSPMPSNKLGLQQPHTAIQQKILPHHDADRDLAFAHDGSRDRPYEPRLDASNAGVNVAPAHTAGHSRNSVVQYRRALQTHTPPETVQQQYGGNSQDLRQDPSRAAGGHSMIVSDAKSDEIDMMDDYYSRYAQKIDSYSNGTDATGHRLSPYATDVLNVVGVGLPTSVSSDCIEEKKSCVEEEVDTDLPSHIQALADSMQSNIQNLEQTIQQLKDDLRRKDGDINAIQFEATEMSYREEKLRQHLQDEETATRNQIDEIDRRKARINILKARIAELEEELTRELTYLEPLERSILSSDEKSMKVENQLFAHLEELDGIEAMKQALQEERDAMARDLEHRESELLSMRAIHELTLSGDCME